MGWLGETIYGSWTSWKYSEAKYVNNYSYKELNELSKKANDKDNNKYVPYDTIQILEPETKSVKVKSNGTTYKFVEAQINGKKVSGNYVLQPEDINADNTVTIDWIWTTDKIKVNFKFVADKGSLPSKVTNLLDTKWYDSVKEIEATDDDVIAPWELAEDDKTVRIAGETWYWLGWDKFYAFNEGKDIVFTGTWSKTKTLVASFEFVSAKKSQGLDSKIIEQVKDIPNLIDITPKTEFDLHKVKAVDGWEFLGWTKDPNAKEVVYLTNYKDTIEKNTHYYGVWKKK